MGGELEARPLEMLLISQDVTAAQDAASYVPASPTALPVCGIVTAAVPESPALRATRHTPHLTGGLCS